MSRERAARGARAGSGPCLEAFGNELGFLYRSLRRQGVRPADAEDLVHDVFLVMWRRWDEYQPSRPLRPWLAGIVYKIARRHLERRRRFSPQEAPEREDPSPGQEERLAHTRAFALITRALDRLPADERAAVVMHELDGIPVRDVARLQAVPLFTAYSRLRRARRKLAEAVAVERAGRAEGRGSVAVKLPALFALLGGEPPLPPGAGERLLARAHTAARGLAGPAGTPGSTAAPSIAGVPSGLALAILCGAGVSLLLVAAAALPRPVVTEAPTALEGARARGVSSARAAARPFLVPASTVAPAAPAEPPSPARRPPVARGSFDEPPGSVGARDGSGNGHHCVLRRDGPGAVDAQGAWTQGVAGGALALDGRHWLECAAFDRPGRLHGELTIAVWMRVAPGAAGKQVLVTRQLGATGDRIFSLRLTDANVELLSHVWEKLLRKRYAATGRWIHVAAVRELGRTSLYLDGALVTGNAAPVPRLLDGAGAPLLIGGQIDGLETGGAAKHLLSGELDELAIYDRALGPDEVHALATTPTTGMTAQLDAR
jgi:RNA polymerase sigma-70 factor, ECF subfamily